MSAPGRTYVIAAVDLAHDGDLAAARKLIDVAVESGCDAVKFQRRRPDRVMVESVLQRPFVSLPEFGTTYGEVLRRLEFGPDDYAVLKAHAEGRIDLVVAPFDLDSLAATAALGVNGLKVDSACATDVPLLEAMARHGGPVVASVAACSTREVGEIVRALRGAALTLLYGVAADPAPLADVNFQAMTWLREFGCPVGFADTTDTVVAGAVAVALGAVVVEKRVTLNRHARGFHHAVSLPPDELRRYVQEIRDVERATSGPSRLDVHPAETALYDEERKALVAAIPVAAGTVLTREMVTCKAPLRSLLSSRSP